MASSSSDGSDDAHDYAYGESSHIIDSRRYPVHDCCEFDDADDLRVRNAMVPMNIFVCLLFFSADPSAATTCDYFSPPEHNKISNF